MVFVAELYLISHISLPLWFLHGNLDHAVKVEDKWINNKIYLSIVPGVLTVSVLSIIDVIDAYFIEAWRITLIINFFYGFPRPYVTASIHSLQTSRTRTNNPSRYKM